MFAPTETPRYRQILPVVIWLVAAVLLIWLLLSLVFFRSHSPKAVGPVSKQTQHHESASPATNGNPGPTNPTPSPANGTPSTPSRLANTGAGDVVVPVVVAVGGGITLYQVRLRRKYTT